MFNNPELSLRISLVIGGLGLIAGLTVSFIIAPFETAVFSFMILLMLGLFFYGRIKNAGKLNRKINQQINCKFY